MTCNCWMAAGRCKSAATSIGLRPRSLISRPSLPQVVVLPEPCRPQSISTVTSGCRVERVVDRPHQVDQLLVDDADHLLVGIERLEHRLADGLLADPGHEVLDDREADVGLEQGLLHQGQAVAHVRLGQPALAAQGLAAPNSGLVGAIRTWMMRVQDSGAAKQPNGLGPRQPPPRGSGSPPANRRGPRDHQPDAKARAIAVHALACASGWCAVRRVCFVAATYPGLATPR